MANGFMKKKPVAPKATGGATKPAGKPSPSKGSGKPSGKMKSGRAC